MGTVVVNGVSSVAPTSGTWDVSEDEGVVTMIASGPATADIIVGACGDVEVDCPSGRSVTIVVDGEKATVTFS